jgi:ATPase subunit of ABC transporter with duplicated ATPase domains
MLVSHDRALLREVCDEFWLVAGGGCSPSTATWTTTNAGCSRCRERWLELHAALESLDVDTGNGQP